MYAKIYWITKLQIDIKINIASVLKRISSHPYWKIIHLYFFHETNQTMYVYRLTNIYSIYFQFHGSKPEGSNQSTRSALLNLCCGLLARLLGPPAEVMLSLIISHNFMLFTTNQQLLYNYGRQTIVCFWNWIARKYSRLCLQKHFDEHNAGICVVFQEILHTEPDGLVVNVRLNR